MLHLRPAYAPRPRGSHAAVSYPRIDSQFVMLCAMPLYEMPARDPYHQKSFRLLAVAAIVLLLSILYVAIWTPPSLGDEARKLLAWVVGSVVILAIVAAEWLSIKRGVWKSKQGLRIEISGGKLTQTRSGKLVTEIPLNQIKSLQQSRRWLMVRSGHSEGGIAIPTDIGGFEELKREISAGRTIQPLRTGLSACFILVAISFIVACCFLFTSKNPAVLITAASAALLIQSLGSYSLVRRMCPNRKAAAFVVASYVLELLVVAWIVYERGFRR